MKNKLILSIGKQLNIPISDGYEWCCQAVYSVAGQMALASLWDYQEDSSTVSIQHFKDRTNQILCAYERIFPELSARFPKDKKELINEIYEIYRRSGYLHHSAYQIAPAVPLSAGVNGIMLQRGFLPDNRLFMSGLGFYSMQESVTDRTIVNLYGLQEQSFDEYLQELLSNSDWESIVWPENTEFLRLDPPFSRGYWKQEPDKDNRISLARHGEPNKLYAFYRYSNGAFQQKQIPEWRVRDWFSNNNQSLGEYRRIAIALLSKYETLPKIYTSVENGLVTIKLGYRLPPSEETFFKLYSWPLLYDFSSDLPQVFTRKMSNECFPAFRHVLEGIGYNFTEESL